MAGNKKFSKTKIEVRQTQTPSGKKNNPNLQLENILTGVTSVVASGMSSFYLGNGMLGKDPNTFISNAAKKNHRSILGDSNSIFELLTNIKTMVSTAKLTNNLNIIGVAAKKYLDELDINRLNVETFFDQFEGLTLILNDILSSINNIKNDNIEVQNKIKFTIQGLNDNAIDKLVELSKTDIDPSSKNSRALSNLLLVMSKFSEIDNKTEEGLDKMNDLIPYLTQLFKNIEKLNSKAPDQKAILDIMSRIKIIFNGISEAKAASEVNMENLYNNVISLNKILDEMNTANQYLNFKGIDDYIFSAYSIFEETGSLDAIFEAINNLREVTPDTMSLIYDNIMSIDNILFTIKNLNTDKVENLDYLVSVFDDEQGIGLKNLFQAINRVSDITDTKKFERIISNITSIRQILKTIDSITVNKNVQEKLKVLSEIFNTKTTNTIKDLSTIFNAVNGIQKVKVDKVEDTLAGLQAISSIINTLNNISEFKKDISTIKQNILDYIDVLDEIYNDIKDRFEKIIELSDLTDKLKVANKRIEEGLDSCHEVAVGVNKKSQDINKGSISLQGFTAFMIGAAVVMSIGALFMAYGGGKFVKNALLFGLTLSIFEALVVTPMLLFSLQENKALPAMNGLNSLVVTCTMTMLIGALFFTFGGGKFMTAALGFGITLGLFEALVIAPIMAFKYVAKDAIESLDSFSEFIVTSTIVMTIGAIFMAFAGGKFVKNSLKFGLTLMVFEALVIAPFLLFSKYSAEATKGLNGFNKFIVVTTTIMMIGALFMSYKNGKFVKDSLKFGLTLMAFEAFVITPFLLFNVMKDSAYNGMKLFTGMVITSTTILIIGALFMGYKDGKYAIEALKFTGLLMAFETGIILPMLIMNKMRGQIFKGLMDFSVMVIASTTCLLIGSLFMTLKGGTMPQAALEFTKVLFWFELGTITPLLLFSKVSPEATLSAKDFGIFIALCTASLIGGAAFIQAYGTQSVIDFAWVLGLFVTGMEVTIGILTHLMKGKALVTMMEFGKFIALSSAALLIGAMFIKAYGSESVLAYGIVLAGFVTTMTFVALGINKMFKSPKNIVNMMAFGVFVGISSLALIAGGIYIQKYGPESAIKFGILLLGFVGLMGTVMAILGKMSTSLAKGTSVAIGLAIAVGALSLSMMAVNFIFEQDPSGENLLGHILILMGATVMMGVLFALLGTGPIPEYVGLGSGVAILMGVAISLLSGSLYLVHEFVGKYKDTLLDEIITLTECVGLVGILFGIMGIGPVPAAIGLGSVAAVALGVALTILGGSLALVHKLVESTDNKLIEDIGYLIKSVALCGALALELIPVGVASTLGLIALIPLSLFTTGLSSAMLDIHSSISKMIELGDFTNQTQMITKNIQAFIDIPDNIKFGGILGSGAISKLATISTITSLVEPLGNAMNIIGEAVQNLASLRVPIHWDKDGKADQYRQLQESDFTLATNNVGKLVYTMADAFVLAWEGGKIGDKTYKGLKEFNNDRSGALWQTLYFSGKIGGVISSISKGISEMAQLKVPTGWDKDGNATGYRKLNETDFKDASKNVGIILTNMVDTILSIYALGGELGKTYGPEGKNLFDVVSSGIFSSDKPSPFVNTLESTLKIGELIGNIAGGIQNIAQLKIPISWNEKGEITKYHLLQEQDFKDASKNVGIVLTHMIETIAGLYEKGKKGGELNKNLVDGNIFDMISGGLLSSDKPSPFINTLEATFKVSELISNIAGGIKDLAKLQIADQWNQDGKAIHYVTLNEIDFTEAGKNVGRILKTVIESISSLNIDTESVKQKIESVTPVTDLISGMADSIIKLAQGQVAIKDNNGNITYRQLNDQDFKKAGDLVENVITYLCEKITSLSNSEQYKDLFKNSNNIFVDLSTGFETISRVISDISKSVIDLSQIELDNKKVTNIDKLLKNIEAFYSSFDISKVNPELFSKIVEDLNKFIYNGINPFEKESYEKSNLLNETINKINKSVSSQKFNQSFSQNTDSLAKYIKTINTINVQKTSELTRLISEINKLNNGNLEGLVNGIVNKLTPVLENLVNSLNESKQTIEKAESVQDKRHKKIDQAMNTIREIMSNEVKVVVSSDTTSEFDDGGSNLDDTSGNKTSTKTPIRSNDEQPKTPQTPVKTINTPNPARQNN